MNWFLVVLKKYATFSGRAQRAEYWWFYLISTLIIIGLSLIDQATGTLDEYEVRCRGAWHRHTTLAPLAQGTLVVARAGAGRGNSPLTGAGDVYASPVPSCIPFGCRARISEVAMSYPGRDNAGGDVEHGH